MILCSLFQDIPEGPEKDQYPGKYKTAHEDPGGPGKRTQIGLSRGLSLHLIQMVKACLLYTSIDGRYLLYIVHAAAPKEAGAIREMIEAEFKGIQIQMMDLSPVFVAQGGPGCVAIQYIER